MGMEDLLKGTGEEGAKILSLSERKELFEQEKERLKLKKEKRPVGKLGDRSIVSELAPEKKQNREIDVISTSVKHLAANLSQAPADSKLAAKSPRSKGSKVGDDILKNMNAAQSRKSVKAEIDINREAPVDVYVSKGKDLNPQFKSSEPAAVKASPTVIEGQGCLESTIGANVSEAAANEPKRTVIDYSSV